MKVKCLLVDDEDLALDVMEEYIKRIDYLQLEGRCNSAVEALSVLNNKKIDLLFLDIQMPGLTGIQLLRNISNPPTVIFTTAYSEYALESYDLEALDYLIKPIPFERFIKAVNRYFKLKKHDYQIPEKKEHNSTDQTFIFVKSEKKMVKVFLHEILYIESLRNYVSIYLANEQEIVTLNTISNIEEKLPETNFLRIHRSFIIAIDKIESFTSSIVQIEQKHIPIGRNYKSMVMDVLKQNSIS
ncbi:LytR/AlgR family response regulator transcription factor [Labilibaculum antarcticum]|uniref:DNA-binding response regulator n=1 Tax=Labilibaculum antarcticum TaxID=1717717 RepID=A0A1Y1CMT0_9BACT|nr:LytTR family DNA-binding domain-containing protein [Labilibaculum antarcticum]BAX81323.1 DNA-binding response regulator [Labilibaculum antarcticum]